MYIMNVALSSWEPLNKEYLISRLFIVTNGAMKTVSSIERCFLFLHVHLLALYQHTLPCQTATHPPRSEHERHAFQCRFVRGEYTTNVPLAITESSHPASECAHDRDTVCCMSTSIGTGLVALGTEQGRVAVWDLDRGLYIIVSVLVYM